MPHCIVAAGCVCSMRAHRNVKAMQAAKHDGAGGGAMQGGGRRHGTRRGVQKKRLRPSAPRPTHRPGSVGALPRLAAACAPKARPAAPCHVGVVGLEKGERRARKGRNTTACSDCSCSLPGTESRGASRQIRSSILFLLRCACAAVRNFWWSCLPGLICCLLPAACCPFRGNGMVATAGGRAAARRPTGRCICICMHACHTHTRS